jgi:signal transduction histidine kinase
MFLSANMTETTEIARLEERAGKLARDKSHLQLLISLINKVNAAQGLDSKIETMLSAILDVVGGANIVLYYLIDDDLYYADVFGTQNRLDSIDDDLVKRVFETGAPLEHEHDFSDTRMLTPEFGKAYTWVFPLMAGRELIGVIKLESLNIALHELHDHMPTFFSYLASVLNNEIHGWTQLKLANDRLNEANSKLSLEIEERLQAEKILQEYAQALANGNRELQAAYDRLKKAQVQLLQQDKMVSIGQLAAGVAHEINNPMGYIICNLSCLGKYAEKLDAYLEANQKILVGAEPAIRQTVSQELVRFGIEKIREDMPDLIAESAEGAQRVKKIVQDLNSFSRVNAMAFSCADIHEGLESTLSVAGSMLSGKVVVEREYGQLPPVWCNLGLLNQVFLNILLNAADAIQNRGIVRITTSAVDESVRIAISDSGCGIPPEQMERIFEPFYSTKQVGQGTGLGLTIAFDIIVNKHGGRIDVASEVGKGSTFTITLPVNREE